MNSWAAAPSPRLSRAAVVASVEARQRGAPYSRTGPSVFVHGPDLLIDTPEEIKFQLNRAGLGFIPACTYSHWHPDHVMGRRVWEMNKDWRGWPPRDRQSDIYLPQQVAADFRERLGSWENFEFLAAQNLVRMHVLQDGEAFTLGKTRILPVRLAADYVYAFLLEEEGKRVLIAPDELVGWDPPQTVRGLDLLCCRGRAGVRPLHRRAHGPRRASRPGLRPPGPALWNRASCRRVIMTPREPFGLSHDDLQRLGAKLSGRLQRLCLRHPTSRGVTQRGTMTSMDYDQLAKAYAPNHGAETLNKLAACCAELAYAILVGCGSGNYCGAAQAHGRFAPVWSARHVDRSDKRAGVRLVQVRQLPFGGSFDLIFSDVIHHIGDAPPISRDVPDAAPRRTSLHGDRIRMDDRNRNPLAKYFPETVEPETARYRCRKPARWMEQAGLREDEDTVERSYGDGPASLPRQSLLVAAPDHGSRISGRAGAWQTTWRGRSRCGATYCCGNVNNRTERHVRPRHHSETSVSELESRHP